jgi:hypothetical protein
MQRAESTAGEICPPTGARRNRGARKPLSGAGRWHGKRPRWTAHRAREMADLRAHEARVRELGAEAYAAEREAYLGGQELLALLAAGRLYPMPLGPAEQLVRALEVPCERTGLRKVRDRDVRVLELVGLATVICHASALAASHWSMGVALACSERTAGRTLRELAACGLLERLAAYDAIESRCGKARGHARVACAYRLGPVAQRCIEEGAELRAGTRLVPLTRELARDRADRAKFARRQSTTLPLPSGRAEEEVSAAPTSMSGPVGPDAAGESSSATEASAPSSGTPAGAATDPPAAPEGESRRPRPLNPYALLARTLGSLDELEARTTRDVRRRVASRLAPSKGWLRANELVADAPPAAGVGPMAELVARFGSQSAALDAREVARAHRPGCECPVCDVLRRWECL